MSAGIPYSAMTGVAAKAAIVTGFEVVPVAAVLQQRRSLADHGRHRRERDPLDLLAHSLPPER